MSTILEQSGIETDKDLTTEENGGLSNKKITKEVGRLTQELLLGYNADKDFVLEEIYYLDTLSRGSLGENFVEYALEYYLNNGYDPGTLGS